MLAIAAHEDGVLIYDISNPSDPNFITTIQTENSWTVTLDDQLLYVADEQTLKMYFINDEFSYFNSIEMSNAIKDIVVSNYVLYIALGSDGVAAYKMDPEFNITLIDVYNTSALANKLAVLDYEFGHKVAVSDWDDVEIFRNKFLKILLI